ncbi:MAG: fibronectin type III-like domain-contianing protein, partial [Ilumatobacter sp.]|nr:fibronectin type III-like domain-contianing protein [Ilumatobacter sp.]
TWGDGLLDVESCSVTATVPITCAGDRAATVVVQGFVEAVAPGYVRPRLELKSWDKLTVEPGKTVNAVLKFDPTAFRRWDTAADDWRLEPGEYDIVLAASVNDERQRHRITIS